MPLDGSYPPMSAAHVPRPPSVAQRWASRVLIGAGVLVTVAIMLGTVHTWVANPRPTRIRSAQFDADVALHANASADRCPPPRVVLTRDEHDAYNPWFLAIRWDVDSDDQAAAIVNVCLAVEPAYAPSTWHSATTSAADGSQAWTTRGTGLIAGTDTFDGEGTAADGLALVEKTDVLDPVHSILRFVRVTREPGTTRPAHVDVYVKNWS